MMETAECGCKIGTAEYGCRMKYGCKMEAAE